MFNIGHSLWTIVGFAFTLLGIAEGVVGFCLMMSGDQSSVYQRKTATSFLYGGLVVALVGAFIYFFALPSPV